MREPSFQDHYPDDLSHCYGCGRLNEHRARNPTSIVAMLVDEPGCIHRSPGVAEEDDGLRAGVAEVLDHQAPVFEIGIRRQAGGVVPA